jgi:uncharacterized membrane protein
MSDGVFAIALTLLVLDLKVPDLPPGFAETAMLEDLRNQVPNFLAWLVSFILLARFWIVHHAIVATLAHCHTGTMIWNFVVLGLVSLMPFAAALVGKYEGDPIAAGVFASILGATGMAIGLLARHVADITHLHRQPGTTGMQAQWRYHARALPLFAAASLLLLVVGGASAGSATAAVALWLVEPAAWFGLRARR